MSSPKTIKLPHEETATPLPPRKRGRPRREIDAETVADAAASLFAEVGFEGVSVEGVANILKVSRATLYRFVPTKDDLMEILFERSTRELLDSVERVISSSPDARVVMERLLRLEIDSAVRMRGYMPVFFGGGTLSPAAYSRWAKWTHHYEEVWAGAVSQAMDSGCMVRGDPLTTTRLLFGMLNWVSRWYRPSGTPDLDEITRSACDLVLIQAD